MKDAFEAWVIHQWGGQFTKNFADFHEEDGYHDQTLNAAWLAFQAGIELADECQGVS